VAAAAAARPRALDLLRRVGLGERSADLPKALSGGMRQRAALARTLMEDRPIVLMDEPFSALDSITRQRLQDLAAELLSGRTVLLVGLGGIGTAVGDQSGVGSPMELQATGSFDWLGATNGVVMSGGGIGTTGVATKVIDALTAADRCTFEIWMAPADLIQAGPARVISIATNTGEVKQIHVGERERAIFAPARALSSSTALYV